MQQVKNWPLILLTASWLVFALIVVSFGPVWSGLLNIIKSLIGLVGLLLSVLCLFKNRSWVGGCLALSAALLGIYLFDWTGRVLEYLSVDPELGLFGTVGLVLSTPLSVSWKLAADGFPLRAFIEAYWTLGMPLLQLVFAALVAYQLKARRVST